MPGLLDTRGGRTYEVLYISSSGFTYLVILTSMGAFNDDPPAYAIDKDEMIEAGGGFYTSLDDLASMYGCVVSSVESRESSGDN